MSQKNRNRDGNGNGRNNNGGRRGGNRNDGVNAKGEQMEILFVEQQFGRQTKVICYLGDGTVIYPGIRRFKPKPGKRYVCDITYKGEGKRRIGLARPVLPYTLSPQEWVPDSDLRHVLLSELVFQEQSRDGEKRLIAFDNGQAVFPDRGTEVTVGRPRTYMLRERGTVSFAIALPEEAQQGGTGLVKLAEKLHEWSSEDLRYIVLKKAQNKSGVAIARTEKDVEIVSEYRNVHELLEVPKDATREQIRKAFQKKALAVHPDRVFQSWNKEGKEPPLLVKMSAQLFFEALTDAQTRALDALDRAEGGPKAATPEARADAPKGAEAQVAKPKSPRKRKPRKAKTVETAPKAAEPVAEATSVDEVIETESAPEQQDEQEAAASDAGAVEADAEASDEGVNAEAASEEKPSDRLTEDGDPIGEDGLVYGKHSVEEWAGLDENVKKFSRRYGKANARKASASGSATTATKAADAGSSTQPKQPAPKGDWREQLSQLKNKS